MLYSAPVETRTELSEDAVNAQIVKANRSSKGMSGKERVFYNNLQDYFAMPELKRVALHVIAQNLNAGDARSFNDAFVSMDSDANGTLEESELEAMAIRFGSNMKVDLKKIAKTMCPLPYNEFLAVALQKEMYMKDGRSAGISNIREVLHCVVCLILLQCFVVSGRRAQGS